ncbi:MAG: hypothetical protein II078_04110 [Muribaculaceae bacterium]|jgi:chemotaxis protein histidine kinase CheA|nr:hypothetical protein [Muribaculaceae bacterium]
MRAKSILLGLLACVALAVSAQPTQQATEWEWYMDEVVSETLVGRNYFEYYYMPSAKDMEQQRSKGEVSYFLNSPEGLNSKKVRDMIDRLMASYDDIKAVSDWHVTTSTYWKEFRYEKNKFRFTVKRKALDDGTYYVSVTETAGYYKSLGNKNQTKEKTETTKPASRKRRDRRPVTQEDVDAVNADNQMTDLDNTPVMSEKERRRAAREREQALEQEKRLAKRRAQEQQREEAKALKEAEKQKKAEEKKQKEEEKRLKKEEERKQREQARREREQERREQAAARKQAAAPKAPSSKYHCNDVALWLSEKYDFTQTSADNAAYTMYSTAVKDVEMAKLAIKNALKGSNARMAIPWRLDARTQEVETVYTVDGHGLIFSIGKNDDGNITLTIIEVSAEDFEAFMQELN